MPVDLTGGHEDRRHAFTRRSFITGAAQGAAALTAASFLAACGGGGAGTTSGPAASALTSAGLPTTSGTGTPVRGGTLTVAGISGGTGETLDPVAAGAFIDIFRSFQLFDRLFLPSDDLQTMVPQLAVSAEPNKDGSVWTIHLRKGVVFHDGTPLTADDVIYSINYWASPFGYLSGVLDVIDRPRMRKRDGLTVEVPLTTPDAVFLARTTSYGCPIIKAGTKPSDFNRNPIGTGPFKFVSFTPGVQSVFVANENYWQPGKPYLGKLICDSSFTAETARVNALLSGAADLLPQSAWVTTRQQQKAGQVTAFGSPALQPWVFVMRVDKGPLADVRVRQAVRLLADRQGLIDGALSGFGRVGNDLLGAGLPNFDSTAKREQDIEQAKSLLKAAGQQDLKVTLATSAVTDGTVQAATLLQQQAAQAGVTINLQQTSPATYFTPAGGIMSGSFRQDYYPTFASLASYYGEYLSPHATLNETFWKNPKFNKLVLEATGAKDPARAKELWLEVQKIQFETGGYLNWTNADSVNLASKKVKGARENLCGSLANGDMRETWIAA
jgi:peptide/nickel transport system substrate-binding protein